MTCSILLKTVTARWHGSDLGRIMRLLDTDKAPMDDILFASVAEACIRTGRLDLLSQRMRDAARSGGPPKLTAPTYGSMIKAYGRARDVERVRELWEEMNAGRIVPTEITVGCMV